MQVLTVSLELKTGGRRVISNLLSPLGRCPQTRRIATASRALTILMVSNIMLPACGQPTGATQGSHWWDEFVRPSATSFWDTNGTFAFKKPTSVLGLIGNLKIAMDRDLLTRPHFYSDVNILEITGAQKVKYKEMDEQAIDMQPEGFDSISEPYFFPVSHERADGLLVRVHLEREPSGRLKGSLLLTVRSANDALTLANIEQIYGKEWRKVTPPPTPLLDAFHPGTTEAMNREWANVIRYEIRDARTTHTVTMNFGENGMLYTAGFNEESN